jgi:hypothetical protein
VRSRDLGAVERIAEHNRTSSAVNGICPAATHFPWSSSPRCLGAGEPVSLSSPTRCNKAGLIICTGSDPNCQFGGVCRRRRACCATLKYQYQGLLGQEAVTTTTRPSKCVNNSAGFEAITECDECLLIVVVGCVGAKPTTDIMKRAILAERSLRIAVRSDTESKTTFRRYWFPLRISSPAHRL